MKHIGYVALASETSLNTLGGDVLASENTSARLDIRMALPGILCNKQLLTCACVVAGLVHFAFEELQRHDGVNGDHEEYQ